MWNGVQFGGRSYRKASELYPELQGVSASGKTVPKTLEERRSSQAAVVECPECLGFGITNCDECGGYGCRGCQRCFSQGREPCEYCTFATSMMGGYCNVCHNSLYMTCRACNGSRDQVCDTCRGDKKFRCETCRGAGVISQPVSSESSESRKPIFTMQSQLENEPLEDAIGKQTDFACVNCGGNFQINSASLGKNVRCPNCKVFQDASVLDPTSEKCESFADQFKLKAEFDCLSDGIAIDNSTTDQVFVASPQFDADDLQKTFGISNAPEPSAIEVDGIAVNKNEGNELSTSEEFEIYLSDDDSPNESNTQGEDSATDSLAGQLGYKIGSWLKRNLKE